MQQRNNSTAIIIIASLFFIFGFVTWINGALIPFMKTINEYKRIFPQNHQNHVSQCVWGNFVFLQNIILSTSQEAKIQKPETAVAAAVCCCL